MLSRPGRSWSCVDVFTDFPPRRKDKPHHHDYAAINDARSYWGDSVAVFRKPATGYPELRVAALRAAVRMWANARPDLEGVPRPAVDPARAQIHAA